MSGWVSSTGWNINLAAPGPIGGTTPSSGSFTTLSGSTSVTSPIVKASSSAGGVLQSNSATQCMQWGAGGGANVTISGGLTASGTVSGTGFSNYLASPPAIGGTTAAAGSFTTLNASSNFTLSSGTANGVVYLDGSKIATSGSALVFNGSNISTTGNLIISTAGKGIYFSGITPLAGMTSQTLADYEEGTWTPEYFTTGGSFTYTIQAGTYTKIGRLVTVNFFIATASATVGSGTVQLSNLPYTTYNSTESRGGGCIGYAVSFAVNTPSSIYIPDNANKVILQYRATSNGATADLQASDLSTGSGVNTICGTFSYIS